jgi:hypothetical protein
MLHRLALVFAAIAIAACSSAESAATQAPGGSLPVEASDPPAGESVPPADETAPTAGDPYPGFEFDRVVQVPPADLPPGIPVPVPAGGTVDDSLGAFEGELLAVDYDPRFYPTAVAFYGTWLVMEGIAASPLVAMGAEAAGWEFAVDGTPVRIEISRSADGSASSVLIYWG